MAGSIHFTASKKEGLSDEEPVPPGSPDLGRLTRLSDDLGEADDLRTYIKGLRKIFSIRPAER